MSEPLAPLLEPVAPMSGWTRISVQTNLAGYGDDAFGIGIYSPVDPTRSLWTRVKQALSIVLLAYLMPLQAKSSDSFTPALGLTLPAVGVVDPITPWGTKLNNNFNIIDVATCDKRVGCTIQGPLIVNGALSATQGGIALSTASISTITVQGGAYFGTTPAISTFSSVGALQLANMNSNGPLYNGSGGIASLPQMGSGGLIMGTGGPPSTGTITGTGITVTNSPGAIALSIANGAVGDAQTNLTTGSIKSGQFTDTQVAITTGALASGIWQDGQVTNTRSSSQTFTGGSGSLYGLQTSSGVNIQGGTLLVAGPGQFTYGTNSAYSIYTTSGIYVSGSNTIISAPYFVGNGSQLTGIVGSLSGLTAGKGVYATSNNSAAGASFFDNGTAMTTVSSQTFVAGSTLAVRGGAYVDLSQAYMGGYIWISSQDVVGVTSITITSSMMGSSTPCKIDYNIKDSSAAYIDAVFNHYVYPIWTYQGYFLAASPGGYGAATRAFYDMRIMDDDGQTMNINGSIIGTMSWDTDGSSTTVSVTWDETMDSSAETACQFGCPIALKGAGQATLAAPPTSLEIFTDKNSAATTFPSQDQQMTAHIDLYCKYKHP